MIEKTNKIVVSGKRKRAIAKAMIMPGNGKIIFNNRNIEHLSMLRKLRLQEPLIIAKQVLDTDKLNFDIKINVKGGGNEGQIEAGRLAISKAIVKFTKNQNLRKAYLNYDRHLLIADTRRKEQYKPGDSKARRKRAKSYR